MLNAVRAALGNTGFGASSVFFPSLSGANRERCTGLLFREVSLLTSITYCLGPRHGFCLKGTQQLLFLGFLFYPWS